MEVGSTERLEWLRDLEHLTEPHRRERAAQHRIKAAEALALEPCDCAPVVQDELLIGWCKRGTDEDTTRRIGRAVLCKHSSRQRWHQCREKGQIKRFATVQGCGARLGHIVCKSCDGEHSVDHTHCDQHRLCIRCRGSRANKLRKRFRLARAAQLRRRRRELSGSRSRRWRERFLTLTFPDSGDPAHDVTAICGAWPAFIKGVRRWLVRVRGVPKDLAGSIPFLRVLEVTPGATGGHAHLHVWILSPFLPHAVLRVLWARALGEAASLRCPLRELDSLELDGREREELATLIGTATATRWPVIDIRAAYGDPSLELVKYLIKDVEQGQAIAPETYAAIYCALEARRTAVTSRSLWLPPQACACKQCGVVGDLRLVIDRHPLETEGTTASSHPN